MAAHKDLKFNDIKIIFENPQELAWDTLFEALIKVYHTSRKYVLQIIEDFVKTEASMGRCVEKIAEAIAANSDVSKVFTKIELYGQKIAPPKMAILATKLIDYKLDIAETFFNKGIHQAQDQIL